MYKYLIPIADDSDFSLARLEAYLKEFYSKNESRTVNIERFGEDQIIVLIGTYPFYLDLSDAPNVPVESAEMLYFWEGDPEEGERLKSCSRRIEMRAEKPDPNMDYFNDSLFIIGEIEKFDGVFIFDPLGGGFV